MRRPSASIAMSGAALFFSFTGAGLAASKYLITSTSQIAPSVLHDLHGQRGLRGRPGPVGATGRQGPAGPAGAPGQQGATGPVGPGSVAQVNAGTGLTGGPITSSGSLSVDFNQVQARVAKAPCPSGAAISDIAQSGAATCTGGLTVSGDVSANGTLNSSTGSVTVARIGTGVYCVSAGGAAMTVTPYYGSGLVVPEVAHILSVGDTYYAACVDAGYSSGWEVVMLNLSGSQTDAGFYFQAS